MFVGLDSRAMTSSAGLNHEGVDFYWSPGKERRMGVGALIIGSLLYLVVAFDFFRKKDYPLCMVFICYAVANIGFILAALKNGKDV